MNFFETSLDMETIKEPKQIFLSPNISLSSFIGENKVPKYAIGLFEPKDGSAPRKRRRLTNLTPEEKVQRRYYFFINFGY